MEPEWGREAGPLEDIIAPLFLAFHPIPLIFRGCLPDARKGGRDEIKRPLVLPLELCSFHPFGLSDPAAKESAKGSTASVSSAAFEKETDSLNGNRVCRSSIGLESVSLFVVPGARDLVLFPRV